MVGSNSRAPARARHHAHHAAAGDAIVDDVGKDMAVEHVALAEQGKRKRQRQPALIEPVDHDMARDALIVEHWDGRREVPESTARLGIF